MLTIFAENQTFISMTLQNHPFDDQPFRLPRSFNEKENTCRALFNAVISSGQTFWHVCTPGTFQSVIFRSPNEYRFAVNAVAMSAHDAGVRVLTFEIMSNHVHIIVISKDKATAIAFFETLKQRLIRYFRELRSPRDLSGFVSDPIPIETLDSLRNQIAYTNRNNYVIDPDHTPFSFPYGANAYYFNPFAKMLTGKRFEEMSDRSKMRLLHSKKIEYPDDFRVLDDMILPTSFCDISLGERFFRDARHYMYKISREVESYKEIAELLGDLAYYTDDELMGVIYSICKKNYGLDNPSFLNVAQKNEVARTLHYDYKADNVKISRLLRLPRNAVDQLFPMSAKK